jgi:hypothetical protein
MTSYLMRLVRSPSTYPLATFWLAAMVIVPLTVADIVNLDTGLILLTSTALFLIVIAMRRATIGLRADVEQVHILVNSQHDDLVKRVSQLIKALEMGGVAVPDPGQDGTP